MPQQIVELFNEDSLELVNFYLNYQGAQWESSWDLSSPLAQWDGVVLNDDDRVIEINLSGNNLTGELQDHSFPYLETLILSDNQLQGNVPNFLHLPNLQILWLDNNELIGQIPNFSQFPSLETLNLSKNNLNGQIPNFSSLPAILNLNIIPIMSASV